MTERARKALDLMVEDAGATTIKGWFKGCLVALVEKGEGFSGKRPYGNSGWSWALAAPLIKEGLLDGELDEDGYVEDCDHNELDKLLLEVVEEIFQ